MIFQGKEYILVLKSDNVATIVDPSILHIVFIINDNIFWSHYSLFPNLALRLRCFYFYQT